MPMSILDKTLREISKIKDLSKLKIRKILLKSYFAVVSLSDGSIGSAGNYDIRFSSDSLVALNYDSLVVEEHLTNLVEEDPLLLNYLELRDQPFKESLYLSIISALSQELLSDACLYAYSLKINQNIFWGTTLKNLLKVSDTVCFIGFGGGLDVFLQSNIKRLYISDIAFKNSF